MTYTAVYFGYRKPGTTPEHFRTRYEQHILLFKEIAGDHFPLAHTRQYIQRTKSEGETEGSPKYPATVLAGDQADFEYDVIAEITYADQAASEALREVVQRPENASRIAADEEEFLDRTK